MPDFPPVPLTLEGSSVLHQFFRFDWKSWCGYAPSERKSGADGERKSRTQRERSEIAAAGHANQSGLVSLFRYSPQRYTPLLRNTEQICCHDLSRGKKIF